MKKRTDKEDTILKEIESFQNKGKLFCFSKQNYNFTERWKRKKENLFNAKKNYLVYEETQAIQRTRLRIGSSSEEEHRANALASGAEEGRDKLR